jgi:DNA polymerase-3 subunit alpha (Gram-positive type)
VEYRLFDFFEEYKPQIPESMYDGMIHKLTYSDNLTRISFYVKFGKLVPADDIFNFEHNMEHLLHIESVRVLPEYSSESFTLDYFSDILALLKREASVINGFLDGAEVTFSGDKLHITLKNGGYDILMQYRIPEKLRGYIEKMFSKLITVELEGVNAVSEEEFKELIQKTEESLPKQSVPVIPVQASADPGQKKSAPTAQATAINAEIADIVPDSAVLIKGRQIRDIPVSIDEAIENQGRRTVIMGDVFAKPEFKEVRGERTVVTIQITDHNNSVLVKIFDTNENIGKMPLDDIKKGCTLLIQGKVDYDNFAREDVMKPDSIVMVKRIGRIDKAEKKRVELHCHTSMSQMDAVTECGELIKRAHKWGHPAIAITDHGIAQAFPDAMNTWNGLKDDNFKVIYGCEAYVVNDLMKKLIIDEQDTRSINDEIIVFDVETTGLSPVNDRVTEIGAVKLRNMQVVDSFQTFVNPERHIPEKITELTGITDAMVANAPNERQALQEFIKFCGNSKPVLAAHNAHFDTSFIRNICSRQGIDFSFVTIDTLVLCQVMLPNIQRHKLNYVAKTLKLGKFDHHRADSDALMLAKIYINLVGQLIQEKKLEKLCELNTKTADIDVKKLKSYHQIILVRNQAGLKNLYKLISYGHIDCFYKRPLIPKSVLMEHREGLIFGSACEAGELFQAMVAGKSHDEIIKLAKFYDYLEIQPAANNSFMIRNGTAANMEELRDYNRAIVKLGEELNIPTLWIPAMRSTERSCKQVRDMTMRTSSLRSTCVLQMKCWKSLHIWVMKRHMK